MFENHIQKRIIVDTLGRPINPFPHNPNLFIHENNYLKLYSSVKTGDMDEFGQLRKTQYLDEVFNHQFLAPRVHYVRISMKAPKCLIMREVMVYSHEYGDKDFAMGYLWQAPGTEPSNHGIDYSVKKCVDGNTTTTCFVRCSKTADGSSKFHISACKFLKYYVFFTLY